MELGRQVSCARCQVTESRLKVRAKDEVRRRSVAESEAGAQCGSAIVGLSFLEDRIASLCACRIRLPPFPQQTPSFTALITLAGSDLARACCIGKAFRIAEERINRNTRNCAPEDLGKSRQENGAKPNEARHRNPKSEGNKAEVNTRPRRLGES